MDGMAVPLFGSLLPAATKTPVGLLDNALFVRPASSIAFHVCIKSRNCSGPICDASLGKFRKERVKFADTVNKTAPSETRVILITGVTAPVPAVRRNFGNTVIPVYDVLPKDWISGDCGN